MSVQQVVEIDRLLALGPGRERGLDPHTAPIGGAPPIELLLDQPRRGTLPSDGARHRERATSSHCVRELVDLRGRPLHIDGWDLARHVVRPCVVA